VATGDVNNDGRVDLITGNIGGNSLSILLGDGRGRFRAAATIPFAGDAPPHLVVLGDLNEDKKLDLVATSHDSNHAVVYLGDGRGGFAPAPGSPFASLRGTPPHNHGLALADVNRDAHLDITTANHNGNSVSVLLGDGHGSFAPAPGSPFAVGRGPYPHAVGDVNGDGASDIATPNVASNNLTVLLGDGRGSFREAPRSPHAVLARPYFALLADVNRDRRLDLLASHDDTSRVTVLLGNGRGGFAPAPGSPVDAGVRGGRLLAADVNGDRDVDLVAASQTGAIVLLGDGRGGFYPAPGSPFRTGAGAWGLTLADVDGDGKPDIATANFESHDVSILLAR
jgi:hypothetical protein